jgi:hypothetical protein
MIGLFEAHIFVSSSLQKMKVVDTKYRNRFDSGRLERYFPVASSHIRKNFGNFVAKRTNFSLMVSHPSKYKTVSLKKSY